MGLRPLTCRWFEVLTPRDGMPGVVEALARTGLVQIETTDEVGSRPLSDELRQNLATCDRLARRYRRYWPTAPAQAGIVGPHARALRRALVCLNAWVKDADPEVEAVERLEHERDELELLAELLDASAGKLPRLAQLAEVGVVLAARAYVLTRDEPALTMPSPVVSERVDGPDHAFVVAVGSARDMQAVEQALEPAKPRKLDLTRWIGKRHGSEHKHIEARLREIAAELDQTHARLDALADAHDLVRALNHLERARWFLTNVPTLPHTQHFARITGWTSDIDGQTLLRAVSIVPTPTLVELPPPPGDRDPPIVLSNRRWVRPFELFSRLLGTPSLGEVDPSVPLSLVVPLLFGFMFGDLGQGLVLVALGFGLRRRFPATAILIPAGFSAALFGIAFGSVFTNEHMLDAVWTRPLEQPITMLAASLAAGVAILTLGLLLRGVGASWRGQLGQWLRTEAAILPIYGGLLALPFDLRSGWIAGVGVLWYAAGHVSRASDKKLRAGFAAAGELLERMLQLGVNTVSFARVGAFALAHAGLSAAIFALAGAAGDGAAFIVILIVGNLMAIVVECLVVSIQTTRLVLFEFFARFLRAEGRAFRPLPPPPGDLARAGEGAAA